MRIWGLLVTKIRVLGLLQKFFQLIEKSKSLQGGALVTGLSDRECGLLGSGGLNPYNLRRVAVFLH